jgi:hypothetical protein
MAEFSELRKWAKLNCKELAEAAINLTQPDVARAPSLSGLEARIKECLEEQVITQEVADEALNKLHSLKQI